MGLELTGRSCIRSTMTQPITIDSELNSPAKDAVREPDALVCGIYRIPA